MALDQTQANSILTYMHGGGAPRTVTGSRLRLLTAIGSSTANGTELASGGSYVASTGSNPTLAGIALSWAASASGSQATNAIASQTNMPVATITSVEVWSTDATPGLRVEFGALTASKTTASGDTLSFASGAITSALA